MLCWLAGRAVDRGLAVRRVQVQRVEELAGCAEVTNINYAEIRTVLGLCPSVREMGEMARKAPGTLAQQLAALHPLLYPLLSWIVVSNKAHIRQLLPSEEIKEMKGTVQFVLLSSSPERENIFKNGVV